MCIALQGNLDLGAETSHIGVPQSLRHRRVLTLLLDRVLLTSRNGSFLFFSQRKTESKVQQPPNQNQD